jgi:RNA recognition motif-containing protein
MGKKLYVGNLAYSINDSSLESLFSEYGTVESAKVITDRDSGRSKGFGFVEMSSSNEAKTAVQQLNEKEFDGRTLKVNEAKSRD